jgi:3-oxoadipate enol-lactonase
MPSYQFSPACRIYYLDENKLSSKPVLLLHGLGANSLSWQFQIPVLQQVGFRSIAPDFPGFGQSTYPGGRAVLHRFIEPIEALIGELQLQRVDVVGISMGGTAALQFALDYPETVNRLVLVNTFANLNVTSPRSLPYFLLRFILVHTLGLPSQAKTVATHIFPEPDQELLRQGLIEEVMQADPRAYRAAMRALAFFDVRDRLSDIKNPTLIITGEQDTTVPVETQTQLANSIHNAKQLMIPHAGHGVTAEKPDIFNQVLVEFLTS